MESLCLGRSHFSTWSIRSARLAVSKRIEKPTLFQAKPKELFSQKEVTSSKLNLCANVLVLFSILLWQMIIRQPDAFSVLKYNVMCNLFTVVEKKQMH